MQAKVSEANGRFFEVMQTVLASALHMMPVADGGVVAMNENDQLVFKAAAGTSWPYLGSRAEMGHCIAEQCLQIGQPIVVDDTRSDPRVDQENFRPSGARSALLVPLPLNGRTAGVLAFYSRVPGCFNRQDILTAQLLAGPIVIGLATTSQARAEQRLVSESRRFAATFEQAAVGIAHVSPAGEFMLVNDRFCEIAGHPRDALLTGGFQKITHPDDLNADLAHVNDLLEGRALTYSMEKRYIRQGGESVWVNLTVSLVRDQKGDPEFFVAVIEDISGRKDAEADAAHDQLTGLLNRRGLLERMDMVVNGRRSTELSLAVAYIDLDGFKTINDQFGHAEGDRCLQLVAAALKDVLRNVDVLARLGGDEFLALLPGSNVGAANHVIQRMRSAVTDTGRQNPWDISASVGAVILPTGACVEPAKALDAADRLMYKAKLSRSPEPLVEVYEQGGHDRPKVSLD